MLNTTNTTSNINFHVNSPLSIAKKPEFSGFAKSPTPPPKVPAGHIYLQNAGVAAPVVMEITIVSITTNTASKTYFRYERMRVALFFFNFGVLILYKSSCPSPTGQRKPHIVLPSSNPNKASIPSM